MALSKEEKAARKREYYARPEVREARRLYNNAYKRRPHAAAAIDAKVKSARHRAYAHITNVKLKYPDAFTGDGSEDFTALELWVEASDGHLCKYCGGKANHIDHIVPLSVGGRHEWSNLQRLCGICNRAKSHMLETEFEDWLDRIYQRKQGTGI